MAVFSVENMTVKITAKWPVPDGVSRNTRKKTSGEEH
jgi:hypothetical protein